LHEAIVGAVAAETGIDAIEIRRRNLARAEGSSSPDRAMHVTIGASQDRLDHRAALEQAVHMLGDTAAERAHAAACGRLFGVGIASYTEPTGMGSATYKRRGMFAVTGYDDVRVMIREDGSASVWTSLPSCGQGVFTTFAQLAAEELRMSASHVHVQAVDSQMIVDGNGSFGSRSAVAGSGAIARVATTIRERLLEIAARELEIAPHDLELVDGYAAPRGSPRPRIAYGDIVAAAPDGYFDASGRFDPPPVGMTYGTQLCAVEVDPGTGGVKLVRFVAVDDCGTVINPMIVEGQLHGGIAQGVGAALLEGIVTSVDGQPLTTSFLDYLLPSAADIPPIRAAQVHHSSDAMARGVRGVGESGIIGATSAVFGAVEDAIGAPLDAIPITPEQVLSTLATTGRAAGLPDREKGLGPSVLRG
jgi:carbon-monoxide dehydrogenase large subunit